MKKRKYIALSIVLVLILSACGKNSKSEVSMGDESQECIQSYFVNGTYNMAISPNGYYKLNGYTKNFLSFIDRESRNEIVLCNKPECSHMDEWGFDPIDTCNANIGSVLPGSIVYHEDYIYVLEYDELTYKVFLKKISKDGSEHEKIMEVGQSPNQASYYSYVFGDESVIYMVYNAPDYTGEERSVSLEKIDISKKEKTSVYTYTSKGACIAYLKVLDDDIYFTQVDRIDDRYIYHLMKYSMSDGSVEQIIDENINSYVLTENGKLVYSIFGEGIFCYDLRSMETKQIQKSDDETMYVSLTYNGTYLVADNMLNQYYYNEESKHQLLVYDLEGKLINIISAPNTFVELSDKDFVFAQSWGDEGEVWKYIRSANIGNKDVVWEVVEGS